MPELPEVETVRRSLIDHLVGRTIVGVELAAFPGVIGDMALAVFAAGVTDHVILDMRRRGKYLLLDLDDGSGIEVHLRMTGSLLLLPSGTPAVRFEHLRILLNDGQTLRYADQRKFGRVVFHPELGADYLQSKLGPEPLTNQFNANYLARRLQGRTAAIKALILDQRIIAGIGNIYADEALFRSRLHPLQPGGTLTSAEILSLTRSIKYVLRQGVENRGTSFSSYRDGYGQEGANQFRLRIYGRGRSNDPCPRCGGPLTIVEAGGRSSHVCVRCQRLRVPVEKPTRS